MVKTRREKRVLEREQRDVQREENRPTRIRVSGNRDILTVFNKEDGFCYRWVLDQGQRIPKFKLGGYELAPGDGLIVGDARTGVASPHGSAVVSVGKDGSQLFLMRIKEEWYKEDQDAKEDEIRANLETMSQLGEGQYGSVGIIDPAR